MVSAKSINGRTESTPRWSTTASNSPRGRGPSPNSTNGWASRVSGGVSLRVPGISTEVLVLDHDAPGELDDGGTLRERHFHAHGRRVPALISSTSALLLRP